MVSKKFKSSIVTRRRSFPPDIKKGRPKRNVSPKILLEDTVSGLSWREERELKKALYASLQESRRSSRDERPDGDGELSRDSVDSAIVNRSTCSPGMEGLFREKIRSPDVTHSPTKTKSETAKSKYHAQRKFAQNSMPRLHSETPQGSFQKRIHAQRKFAQGSLPSTPSETPSKPKFKASPVRLFPVRPKTEDFLTYLCFRGTNLLPPHMDLLNVHRDSENVEPSTPVTNGRSGHTRESSPASSSTLSHNNEESVDIPDLTPRSQTPNRKAARASASTPETARGFLPYPGSGRHSARNSSPLSRGKQSQGVYSRTRYAERFTPASRVLKMPLKQSPINGSATDRLALKRKAMATLTAAKRTEKSKGSGKMFKKTVSEGELMKRKANLRDRHPITFQKIEKDHSPSRSSQSKKRKSSSDQSHDSPPSTSKKMKKLRSSERVRNMIKTQPKSQSGRTIHRKYYDDFYEIHPIKKLSTTTSIRHKRVKHKGPVTRASSHLKSMMTSAKLAATRKLRMLRRANQTPLRRANQTPLRNHSRLSSIDDVKKHSSRTPKQSPTESLSGQKSSPSPNKGVITSPKPSSSKCEPFPKDGERPSIVQCPTFTPAEEQFKDPLEYIQSIAPKAEPYGICKIVPPPSWKMESRVIDDLRFTCQNQHIHKMLHRWGPNSERLEAIKRHFESTGNEKFQCPQIGGVEVDLVKLYDVVQRYGGMKRIVDKKKWMKVADAMKIPKQAQDRITKLYSVYCKFLLSFETLTEEEKQKIEHSVQTDRQKQEKHRTHSSTDGCIEKGRTQPFSAFNRAARNTLAMFGREDSESWSQVESDYWDYVESGQDHVCVQSATLDTSIYGSMFPVRRDNPYSRHPWNLHNFIQSKGCVLHQLGLIADVTVPTLRFGMLYTTSCLSCDSHNLPTVQYLHQGADIIWYAVPRQKTGQLKKALKETVPSHVRDKGFMLEKDSVMVPPESLVEHGVPMSRCVQSSREFVVVFPGAYHCNISCGYTLSESVHYASQSWIPFGYQAAKDLSANHDAELFSMDAMLVFLARDLSTTEETLSLLLPYLKQVVDRELSERQKLCEAGLKNKQKLPNRSARLSPKSDVLEEIVICDVSKKICYLSMVLNESENSAFSLEQGLLHIKKKKKDIPNCKLMYRFSEEELKSLVKDVKERMHKSEPHPSPTSTRMTLRNSAEKSSPLNSSR